MLEVDDVALGTGMHQAAARVRQVDLAGAGAEAAQLQLLFAARQQLGVGRDALGGRFLEDHSLRAERFQDAARAFSTAGDRPAAAAGMPLSAGNGFDARQQRGVPVETSTSGPPGSGSRTSTWTGVGSVMSHAGGRERAMR